MSNTRTQARAALEAMLAAPPTPEADAEIRTAVLAANERPILPEELAGYADALRAAAVPIAWPEEATDVPSETAGIRPAITDTCGTGGDQRNTFNISTAAGLLAAAAGVPVAKHGNRSATSKCGSADVLEALGIAMQGPQTAAAALRDLHFAFLFAPAFHPGMARVAPIRRALGAEGHRTFFNLLGPLANPAGAQRQLIGTWSRSNALLLARTLALLGAEHAMVVHASDGLDEITLTGPTYVAEARGGNVCEYELAPGDFGFATHAAGPALQAPYNPYAGSATAAGNAAILRDLFQKPASADHFHREVVLVNAAAVFVVAGRANNWLDGVALAAHTLDSGRAAAHLQRLHSRPSIE
jgi:anthranilate phosphoribosyltransferase